MSAFLAFLNKLILHLRINISIDEFKDGIQDEYEIAATVLNEINKFLYQRHATLETEYISEFHKYWKYNHEEVLQPFIGEKETLEVAKVLENIYANNTIRVQLNTRNLTPEEINCLNSVSKPIKLINFRDISKKEKQFKVWLSKCITDNSKLSKIMADTNTILKTYEQEQENWKNYKKDYKQFKKDNR